MQTIRLGLFFSFITFDYLGHLVHVRVNFAVVVDSVDAEDQLGLYLSEPLQHTLPSYTTTNQV